MDLVSRMARRVRNRKRDKWCRSFAQDALLVAMLVMVAFFGGVRFERARRTHATEAYFPRVCRAKDLFKVPSAAPIR